MKARFPGPHLADVSALLPSLRGQTLEPLSHLEFPHSQEDSLRVSFMSALPFANYPCLVWMAMSSSILD